jgi:D-alanine-D-alanine ligase
MDALKVLVLAGGPDRERPVSLRSGERVAHALREAGHEVRQSDILPDDLSALDAFEQWGGDVIFPVLHGSWGEGGPLQRLLDARGLRYVGCRAEAAELCMDKLRTKQVLAQRGLPTPAFETLRKGQVPTLPLPLVLKAPREGSSIDLVICRDSVALHAGLEDLYQRHRTLLAEAFITGKELTVGVIGRSGSEQVLPPIQIVPATEFYDYEAKYTRDDTQYLFDIDEPPTVLSDVKAVALAVYRALGCRHLSRVDVMLDAQHRPWVLEVNTIPGFTDHSLLPKAARETGLAMPALVDMLVQLAAGQRASR